MIEKTLLLVEEDDSIAKTLKLFIEHECTDDGRLLYKVLIAHEKKDAFEMLEAFPIDVLLMDYWLSYGPVTGLIQSAREWWNSRVILMTTMNNYLEIGEKLGVDFAIRKPFGLDELCEILAKKIV